MKDIPVFATENGVGSLVLREIPYTATAYVRIQSTQMPLAFLEECVSFCRACGAGILYGTGHLVVESFPVSASLVEMCCPVALLRKTDVQAHPVLSENGGLWRRIYNERMRGVPNAAYMDLAGERDLVTSGEGYFVYEGDQLIGIGRVREDTLEAVASVQPGSGEKLVKALCGLVVGDQVRLTVAVENQRAVKLYERLGFVTVRDVSRWYKIF